MPKTVIVPLDGSEAAEYALGPAQRVAGRAGARLLLVTARLGGPSEPHDYLERLAERIGAGPIVPETLVIEDRLAPLAVEMVASESPDPLVCMRTHGPSGFGMAILGSVAEEVLDRVRAPVLLVGPEARDEEPETLVICVDETDVSRAVVPVAATFARDLGLDVWLVQVVEPEARPTIEKSDVPEEAPLHVLAEVIEPECPDANWEVLHGPDPASAIVEFAGGRPGPMLAMATHGRRGLDRIVLGSVTMGVVRDAPGPVLTLRAPDTD